MNKRLLLATALAVTLAGMAGAQAAEIVPVYFDGAGEGYNDPTRSLRSAATPAPPAASSARSSPSSRPTCGARCCRATSRSSSAPSSIRSPPNVLGSAGATIHQPRFPRRAPARHLVQLDALADALSGAGPQSGLHRHRLAVQFDLHLLLRPRWPDPDRAGQLPRRGDARVRPRPRLRQSENEAAGTSRENLPDIYSTFTFDNTHRQALAGHDGRRAPRLGHQLRQRRVHRSQRRRRGVADPGRAPGLPDHWRRRRSPATIPMAPPRSAPPISPANFSGNVVLAHRSRRTRTGPPPRMAAARSPTRRRSPATSP